MLPAIGQNLHFQGLFTKCQEQPHILRDNKPAQAYLSHSKGRAASYLAGPREDEDMLAGSGLTCPSPSPAPWVNFLCVLGRWPLREAALPTIHPSFQDPSVEQEPVRHSRPAVSSTASRWTLAPAAGGVVLLPLQQMSHVCERASPETLVYCVVSRLT